MTVIHRENIKNSELRRPYKSGRNASISLLGITVYQILLAVVAALPPNGHYALELVPNIFTLFRLKYR